MSSASATVTESISPSAVIPSRDGSVVVVFDRFHTAFTKSSLFTARSSRGRRFTKPVPLERERGTFVVGPSAVVRDGSAFTYHEEATALNARPSLWRSAVSPDGKFGAAERLPAERGGDVADRGPRRDARVLAPERRRGEHELVTNDVVVPTAARSPRSVAPRADWARARQTTDRNSASFSRANQPLRRRLRASACNPPPNCSRIGPGRAFTARVGANAARQFGGGLLFFGRPRPIRDAQQRRPAESEKPSPEGFGSSS